MVNKEDIQSVATAGLEGIFDYVKARRSVDFSAYRKGTMERRLALRLARTGTGDYPSYLGYLEKTPSELDALVEALTIKVSAFFRNPLVFEALASVVLPEMAESRKEDVIKVWCAGCAMGEEPYSVAMLLKELLLKEPACCEAFVLGTDIDAGALEHAKKAEYEPGALLEVKKKYMDRHFRRQGGLYALDDEIKSMVAFASHDVTALAPPREGVFKGYHLVLCRNVVIYFEKALSDRVLGFLSGLLESGGYLVLGEAECLPPGLARGFEEIMPKTRIYRKTAGKAGGVI